MNEDSTNLEIVLWKIFTLSCNFNILVQVQRRHFKNNNSFSSEKEVPLRHSSEADLVAYWTKSRQFETNYRAHYLIHYIAHCIIGFKGRCFIFSCTDQYDVYMAFVDKIAMRDKNA